MSPIAGAAMQLNQSIRSHQDINLAVDIRIGAHRRTSSGTHYLPHPSSIHAHHSHVNISGSDRLNRGFLSDNETTQSVRHNHMSQFISHPSDSHRYHQSLSSSYALPCFISPTRILTDQYPVHPQTNRPHPPRSHDFDSRYLQHHISPTSIAPFRIRTHYLLPDHTRSPYYTRAEAVISSPQCHGIMVSTNTHQPLHNIVASPQNCYMITCHQNRFTSITSHSRLQRPSHVHHRSSQIYGSPIRGHSINPVSLHGQTSTIPHTSAVLHSSREHPIRPHNNNLHQHIDACHMNMVPSDQHTHGYFQEHPDIGHITQTLPTNRHQDSNAPTTAQSGQSGYHSQNMYPPRHCIGSHQSQNRDGIDNSPTLAHMQNFVHPDTDNNDEIPNTTVATSGIERQHYRMGCRSDQAVQSWNGGISPSNLAAASTTQTIRPMAPRQVNELSQSDNALFESPGNIGRPSYVNELVIDFNDISLGGHRLLQPEPRTNIIDFNNFRLRGNRGEQITQILDLNDFSLGNSEQLTTEETRQAVGFNNLRHDVTNDLQVEEEPQQVDLVPLAPGVSDNLDANARTTPLPAPVHLTQGGNGNLDVNARPTPSPPINPLQEDQDHASHSQSAGGEYRTESQSVRQISSPASPSSLPPRLTCPTASELLMSLHNFVSSAVNNVLSQLLEACTFPSGPHSDDDSSVSGTGVSTGTIQRYTRSYKYTSQPDSPDCTSQCPICLGRYVEGTQVIQMACGHVFHFECAHRWLRINRRCALCRTDISSTVQ